MGVDSNISSMENKQNIGIKISKEELLKLINPHLKKHYSFVKEEYEIKTYSPNLLFFNTHRFDVVIKYIYVY